MIPKVECCISALAAGVNRTHIVDGRILHAILLEIFTDDSGVGTILVP
jgi:acetylglutamate kinase